MRCFQHHSDPAAGVHEPQSWKRPLKIWRRSWSAESVVAEDRRFGEYPRPVSDNAIHECSNSGPSLRESGSQRSQDLRVFTCAELKTATRNFHRGNFLGEGGFGCVYSGIIRHKQPNGGEAKIEIAVKQLNRKGLQGHKEWLAEVNFLGRVEHPNLVKLIGYCAEDDSRGIQRLLVYEFMPNKSLDDHLFYRLYPVLPWHTRVSIALGAAKGLSYLHEEMEIQVIFRDFKTSNVLLDNDFNPKLSDFGLARQGPGAGDSHVTTAIVGTIGYAAPEYLQTGHLTAKSDVWSFGIVLLELLTGRRSVDKNRPKNEQKLLDWVRPFLRDGKKFSQLMDPRMEGAYPLKAAHRLATLASHCLQRQARSRPRMSDVVESLKTVLEMSEAAPHGSPRSVITSSADPQTDSSKTTSSTSSLRTWSIKDALYSVTVRLLVWRKISLFSFLLKTPYLTTL